MLIVHLFLAHIGYSTIQPAARFAGFLKEKLIPKQTYIGRLAEWSKAGAMLNDVNRNSERSFKHRRFESCTFHKHRQDA